MQRGGMAKHSSLSIECVFQARLQDTHSNKHKKDSFFFNRFSVHDKKLIDNIPSEREHLSSNIRRRDLCFSPFGALRMYLRIPRKNQTNSTYK